MVNLNNFIIDEFLVTKKDWDGVRLWAKERGYNDLSVGRGKGNQPVGCISWYDAVKFCNALSELAGLTPVYHDFDSHIYKNGNIDIDESCIDKTANGYRLPNVNEWKYAAQGGANTKYFWGDTEYPDCIPYVWESRNDEITHDVGTKKPNPYGLYDMIGNADEWCFDKKHEIFRTVMGGSVALDSILTSEKESYVPPDYKCYVTGMRVVSDNVNAKSVRDVSNLSEFYGQEEWPSPIYPDMDIEKIADRFKNLLGENEFAKELNVDILKGDFNTAFKKFRNKKFKEFKQKYIVKFDAPTMLRTYDYLDKFENIYDIVFYKGNYEFDVYEGLPEFENIADKFNTTRDIKYLKLYIKLVEAYVIRQKAEFDVLDDEILRQCNDTPLTWAWGNGFNPGKRSMRIMTSIAILSNALSEDEYDLFPAELFAELAVSLSSYGLYPSLKDGREKVSNQISHCNGWIISVCVMFPEFKYASLYEKFAYNRWIDGLDKVLYPDGSAVEQALHYNYAPLESYFAMVERFQDVHKFDDVKNKILNTARMLSAISPVINDMPICGYTGCQVVAPNPKSNDFENYMAYVRSVTKENISTNDIDRIKELAINPDGDKPKFKSVFFPYGGTSVIRDGWNRNDRYMYFFAPRVGSGHSAEAVCDIQIQAFGRFLLRTGGRTSYRLRQNISNEDYKMMDEADEYMKSTFSRNTILVDDMGQSRLSLNEQIHQEKYSDTTGYRWYESENIVYTEGEYSDGFYSCDDVVHKREIVFLNKSGLWIVVDRLKSEKPHKYTQLWHLSSSLAGKFSYTLKNGEKVSWIMDGYSDDDIVLGDNEIYTKQKNEANVYIRHMDNMKYKKVCGQRKPVRGWSGFETQDRFRYFPVHEIYCDFEGNKDSVIVTVIEACEKENSELRTISKNSNLFEFIIKDEKIKITKDTNGRIEIYNNEKPWLVLDNLADDYREIIRGFNHEFLKPSGMHWEEKDTYAIPVYEYSDEK